MSFFETYLVVVVGILISVVLPILRKLLIPTPGDPRGLWDRIKLYVLWGIFSLLTALLVVAFLGNTLSDWKAALIAGYAWDSTMQKIGS
jgi:hypothetical protein